MKTYTLEVLAPANEDLVADILAALHKQQLIRYAEAPEAGNPALLSAAEIELDILEARQQTGISLADARTKFSL